MRHRVLLVEDSPDYQKLVCRSLQDEAQVVVAADLKSAQQILEKDPIDLLLLDVTLPDGNGFGLCSRILADMGLNRPRIVFLTGSGKIADKLTGFSVGADDYLVKPFEPLELKARVQAQLRNQREITEAAQSVKVGNVELNLVNYLVEIQSTAGVSRPEFTRSEFQILYQLAKNEGRVQSREQLLSALSEDNLEVSDRVIDVHISRIRKKLLGSTHVIEPIYGVGYRLTKGGES